MRMGAANARVAIRGCAGQCESFTGDLMNRREFLRRSGGLAAGAVSLQAFPYHLYAAERPKQASDVVPLGDTGLNVSRLAMGTGTNGAGALPNKPAAWAPTEWRRCSSSGSTTGHLLGHRRPVRQPPAPAARAARRHPAREGHDPHQDRGDHRGRVRADLDRFRGNSAPTISTSCCCTA